jgi:PGF-CTERM protein
MRRRTLLKAGAGALPLALASTTASGDRTTQDAFEPLDSIELDDAAEVYVDGDAAYVAAGDGLIVVDVSEPANLSVLAEQREVEIGGQVMQKAYDLWAWEDQVALVGPIQPVGGGTGFVIFDVSDPAQPEIVTKHDTGYYVHNSSFADGMLYLVGSGLVRDERRLPLVTYDLSGDEPEEVGRWSPVDHDEKWGEVPIGQRVLHDIHVQDGVAYLSYWDSGAWLVDVSDPAQPEVLSRVGDYTAEELSQLGRQEAQREYLMPDGNAHVTVVNEDSSLMAVGVEAWAGEIDGEMQGGAGAIDLYDISDKTDPQHRSTIEPPESFDNTRAGWFTTAHNPYFKGDRLYSSWYYGGVKIHDVSDPANPEELAWWRDPREANFWAAFPGEGDFFVGTSWSGGSEDGRLLAHSPGLYTFPDRAGEQPDPPDLTSRPEDLLSSSDSDNSSEDSGESGSRNGSENGGESGNGNGGESGDGESGDGDGDGTVDNSVDMENGDENGGENGGENSDDDENSDGDDQESDDGSGPGFGVGGALTAIGAGSYALARRAGLVDDED